MNADGAGAARSAGGDVDDPAPFARPHRRQNGLGAQEGRFQIDRDGLVEFAFGEVVDAAYDRHPGIVDENVDRPEVASDPLHHLRDGSGLRYVGRHRYSPAARALDLRDDRSGIIGSLAIIDRDRGARLGERNGNRCANAAGCARHQRRAPTHIRFDGHGLEPVNCVSCKRPARS